MQVGGGRGLLIIEGGRGKQGLEGEDQGAEGIDFRLEVRSGGLVVRKNIPEKGVDVMSGEVPEGLGALLQLSKADSVRGCVPGGRRPLGRTHSFTPAICIR